MSLMPGFYKAKIVSHTISSSQKKGTPFVGFRATVEGHDEEITFPVWLSQKAAGMARAALKRCGFDIDKHALKILRENQYFLKDNEVTLEYEIDDQYGGRFQVALSQVNDDILNGLTDSLRDVKKKDETKPEDEEDLPF